MKEIKSRGLKPIINTNGIALTKQLLHELKKAGVFGFTFHIDSKQGRGREEKWRNKNEVELNELRLYYAEMLAAEGESPVHLILQFTVIHYNMSLNLLTGLKNILI